MRFFTVYGPWGRPDMAPYIFVKKITEGKTITVYNHGDMERDFTYIDDIINGVYKVVKGNNKENKYNIYNIGNSESVNLNEFIYTIEKVVKKKAKIDYRPIRAGDVKQTFSDISNLQKDYDYRPKTGIEEGLNYFYTWYNNYIKKHQSIDFQEN